MVAGFASPLPLSICLLPPVGNARVRQRSARLQRRRRNAKRGCPAQESVETGRQHQFPRCWRRSAFPFPPSVDDQKQTPRCLPPSRPLFLSPNCSVPARETNERPKAPLRARRWTESSSPWARGGPWIGCRRSGKKKEKEKGRTLRRKTNAFFSFGLSSPVFTADPAVAVPWPCSWR